MKGDVCNDFVKAANYGLDCGDRLCITNHNLV